MNFFSLVDAKILKFQKFNLFFLISFILIFSIFFFITSNLINKKNKTNEKNFEEITKSSEFSNLTNFFISKINSPYKEINYIIKNNDSVEKILRSFKVQNNEIKDISIKLKGKKTCKYIFGKKT